MDGLAGWQALAPQRHFSRQYRDRTAHRLRALPGSIHRWQQLDAQCKPEDDCRVLTIPHNINWADGGPTFAVSEDMTLRTLRAKV